MNDVSKRFAGTSHEFPTLCPTPCRPAGVRIMARHLFQTKFTTSSIMVSVSWQTNFTSVFGKHISRWHEWRGYLDLVDLGPDD